MITFSAVNRSYTLQLHSLKHPVYLHNQSEFKFNYYSKHSKCPFSFIQAGTLFRHSSLESSTIICDKLLNLSIKRCLRWVTSRTGVWYTRSYIMPHIRWSAGLRSGLFGDQKSGGMNFGVSRWRSSIVWLALSDA